MKINSDAARQAQELYGKHNEQAQAARKAAETETAPAQKPDRAEISAAGRLKAHALEAVKAAPETRTELVKSLHDQVKSGAYTVNDQQLAGHITGKLNIGA